MVAKERVEARADRRRQAPAEGDDTEGEREEDVWDPPVDSPVVCARRRVGWDGGVVMREAEERAGRWSQRHPLVFKWRVESAQMAMKMACWAR